MREPPIELEASCATEEVAVGETRLGANAVERRPSSADAERRHLGLVEPNEHGEEAVVRLHAVGRQGDIHVAVRLELVEIALAAHEILRSEHVANLERQQSPNRARVDLRRIAARRDLELDAPDVRDPLGDWQRLSAKLLEELIPELSAVGGGIDLARCERCRRVRVAAVVQLLAHRVEHGLQLDLGENVIVPEVIELVQQPVAVGHGVEAGDGERVDDHRRPFRDAECHLDCARSGRLHRGLDRRLVVAAQAVKQPNPHGVARELERVEASSRADRQVQMTARKARCRCHDDARELGALEVLVAIEGDGADFEVAGVAGYVLRQQNAGRRDRKKKQQRGEKNPSHHPRVRAGNAALCEAWSGGSISSGARSAKMRAM